MLRDHFQVSTFFIRMHFWLCNESRWGGKEQLFYKVGYPCCVALCTFSNIFKVDLPISYALPYDTDQNAFINSCLFVSPLPAMFLISYTISYTMHSHFPEIRAGAAIALTIIWFLLPNGLMCHVSLKPVLTQKLPHFQITKELSSVRGQGLCEGYGHASSVSKFRKHFKQETKQPRKISFL